MKLIFIILIITNFSLLSKVYACSELGLMSSQHDITKVINSLDDSKEPYNNFFLSIRSVRVKNGFVSVEFIEKEDDTTIFIKKFKVILKANCERKVEEVE